MSQPQTFHSAILICPTPLAIFVVVGIATIALFEVTSSDGSVVIGAGFQNLYNTRYLAFNE